MLCFLPLFCNLPAPLLWPQRPPGKTCKPRSRLGPGDRPVADLGRRAEACGSCRTRGRRCSVSHRSLDGASSADHSLHRPYNWISLLRRAGLRGPTRDNPTPVTHEESLRGKAMKNRRLTLLKTDTPVPRYPGDKILPPPIRLRDKLP